MDIFRLRIQRRGRIICLRVHSFEFERREEMETSEDGREIEEEGEANVKSGK